MRGGDSPVDIMTVPEPIEHSDVRGLLLRLLRVSGWSTLTIPGSGWMVGRAIQMTVIPQLALGPGDTLVDASAWSASVLMVNPNADEIVLPCFTCVRSLVPVSAVAVALAEPVLPGEVCGTIRKTL